ncbi:hypothetical protein [Bacterioplanoides sp.]|uniref:hypothetical protein n=1 Tax=Bacterioplanoides sp. TaxID=2066072 RepID=UPI003AFFA97A
MLLFADFSSFLEICFGINLVFTYWDVALDRARESFSRYIDPQIKKVKASENYRPDEHEDPSIVHITNELKVFLNTLESETDNIYSSMERFANGNRSGARSAAIICLVLLFAIGMFPDVKMAWWGAGFVFLLCLPMLVGYAQLRRKASKGKEVLEKIMHSGDALLDKYDAAAEILKKHTRWMEQRQEGCKAS